MYDLPYHKAKNEQDMIELMQQFPFAFLSGCNENKEPIATQVPVFFEALDGRKILSGHIMRNTDHHKAFIQNQNVLVVFTGRHSYVSATWYSNPHSASTWNYMSVHAKGIIRFLEDEALDNMLQKTSLHFENYNQQSETVFDNLPQEFKQRVMKAIVAFEIDVTEMNSVFKLSQDRDEKSYRNIISKLTAQGGDGKTIATEMEKRLKDVFPDAG